MRKVRSGSSPSSRAGDIVKLVLLATLGTYAERRLQGQKSLGVRAGQSFPERGRQQAAASEDQPQGWFARAKSITMAVFSEIGNDRVLAVAAGVAFYGLLALFPAITTLVSLYGLFKDPSSASADLATLTSMLPQSVVSIISDQITRIINNGSTTLSLAAAVSLLIALWSANSGMKAAMDALNVAYGVKETRSFIKLNAISLFFTLSAVIVLLLIVAAIAVVPVVLSAINMGPLVEWLVWAGRWPLLLVLANLALAVLYRWGPCVPDAKWRWVSPGTILASIGFAVLSVAFSIYAENFANFNKTYGSLGAVIAFLTWSWLATVIMLIGAELNAELDRRRNLLAPKPRAS